MSGENKSFSLLWYRKKDTLMPLRGSLGDRTVFHLAFEVSWRNIMALIEVCENKTSLSHTLYLKLFLFTISLVYSLVNFLFLLDYWLYWILIGLVFVIIIVHLSGTGVSSQYRRPFHARHKMGQRLLCSDCFRAADGLDHVQTSSGTEKRNDLIVCTGLYSAICSHLNFDDI